MLSIYTCYKCVSCRFEFVVQTEDVNKMAKDRYLVCPFCNSKKVIVEDESDSLKECMKESVYKKVHGSWRQVR